MHRKRFIADLVIALSGTLALAVPTLLVTLHLSSNRAGGNGIAAITGGISERTVVILLMIFLFIFAAIFAFLRRKQS